MATAKRCDRCKTDWPALVEFTHCPECGNETEGTIKGDPIGREEAERRVKFADFERRYTAREAQRIADGRPLPSLDEINDWLCQQMGREVEAMRRRK